MPILNRFLPTSKHQFEDIFEEANYLITLRFTLFLVIAIQILFIAQFISFDKVRFILVLFSLIISGLFYVYIYKTGKYKFPAILGNILYAIIIQLALYNVPKNPHVIEGLWMVNNVFFAYRCVNKNLGLAIGLIHGISISIHYLLNFNNHYELTNEIVYNWYDKVGISINIFSAFLVFTYFLHQTIDTNRRASLKIKLVNDEMKKQFETINKQNEEKTILLKEIHHRVKNNLQLIVSLLRLQSYELTDKEAINQFEEAINRIITIASVHEKIYQNDSLSKVNIESYFKEISQDIISMSEINSKINIDFEFQLNSIKLKPIIPLALIFNELISNSIKHFDIEKENLQIKVEFKYSGQNNLMLIYHDNGTWKEKNNKKSLGLELIAALTKQIDGTMQLIKEPETKYTFEFQNII
jgi:two-component sensor histidine kinase